jgi:hypothetical protein
MNGEIGGELFASRHIVKSRGAAAMPGNVG